MRTDCERKARNVKRMARAKLLVIRTGWKMEPVPKIIKHRGRMVVR